MAVAGQALQRRNGGRTGNAGRSLGWDRTMGTAGRTRIPSTMGLVLVLTPEAR